MQPGDLNRRISILQPTTQERSATGGSRQDWDEVAMVWAHVHYLRGGEAVQASRMQGRRPAIVTIGDSSVSAQIKLDWRLEFDDTQFEVREFPKPVQGTGYVELMVEAKI